MPLLRLAVGLGDVAAGERRVPRDHGSPPRRRGRSAASISQRSQAAPNRSPRITLGRRPPTAGAALQRVVRHRVAVDQHRHAEAGAGLGEQRAQPVVVGMPALGDAPLRLGQRQLALHDRPALADDPRDHARARRRFARSDSGGVAPAISAGSRSSGARLRSMQARGTRAARSGAPAARRRGEELVDEGVLGRADLQRPEQRRVEKGRRIVGAAVRRAEHRAGDRRRRHPERVDRVLHTCPSTSACRDYSAGRGGRQNALNRARAPLYSTADGAGASGARGSRAYSSAGEHFVDIEGVTGSIPVTPTIYPARENETKAQAFRAPQ